MQGSSLWLAPVAGLQLPQCPRVTYFSCSVRRPVVQHRYNIMIFLVESLGYFYRIEMYHYMPTDVFSNLMVSPINSPCALAIYRLVLPSHEWQVTNSIGNKVFALGHHFCNSYTSSSVKDGLINFGGPDGRFLSFDVKSGSLTTRHLDNSKLLCEESMYTMDATKPPPFWLLLEDDVRVDGSGIIGKHKENLVLNPLKHLPTSSSRALHKRVRSGTKKGASFSPSTPWLLLRRRFGSKFALLDPISNKVYKLRIPQLSKTHICYSKDGWLLAYSMFLFFFNPVTGERINLPNKEMVEAHHLVSAEGGISLSSPPTSADCLLFTIMPYGDHHEGGQIRTFRLSDSSFTRLEYSNSLPIELSYTSPVYLKGLFYCLGREGNLGVYDPVANSWTVMNPSIPFDSTIWKEPFLLESQSELLSVFLDEFGILIGVCTFDFDSGRWRKLAHLGDRTLFVGREGSFIVPAARPEMGNKVYTPMFYGEYGSQLVSYEVGIDAGCRKGLTKVEYPLHIWIQPKGAASFEFGMDQVTGQATPQVLERRSKIRKKQKSKTSLG